MEASGAYRGTREKPTFRRGKRPCRLTDSHNENLEQGNNYQEGEVICLKASDKLAVATQPRLLILPKGNERCQGRNGRTYCAHVGAKGNARPVVREMADQNCTGHIADNLAADKRGHECAASIQNGAKEIGNGGDLSNVPAKNEEADKCHHQGVIGLCEYPSVGNGKNNDDNVSQAIATYADSVAEMDEQDYEEMWNAAQEYNEKLFETGHGLGLKKKEKKEYNNLLNVSGTGIMSYIEIPKIKCSLPIYHGTDEGVLQIAIGHIEGSSLPVGGVNTHCVLSGHRGLPSAKLFSNLDKLEEGDIFMIRTLDQTLTYEVDQIRIVLPDEVDDLKIEEGKDLCTLVTCTPYGINTHRLLVRGHRVANREEAEAVRVTADAMQVDNRIVATCIAVPVLLILLAGIFVSGRRKR